MRDSLVRSERDRDGVSTPNATSRRLSKGSESEVAPGRWRDEVQIGSGSWGAANVGDHGVIGDPHGGDAEPAAMCAPGAAAFARMVGPDPWIGTRRIMPFIGWSSSETPAILDDSSARSSIG